eukprot:SAG31_NODE_12632_length_928_cov_1.114596_1_plen_304_part_01
MRWHYYDSEPLALLAPGYSNYQISVEAMLPSPAVLDHNASRYIAVCGRQDKLFSGWTPSLGGYCVRVNLTDASWNLVARNRSLGFGLEGESQAPPTTLAHGALPASTDLTKWHELSLRFQDDSITASLDGHELAAVNDSTYSAGLAGFGSGWHFAHFQRVSISVSSAVVPDTAGTVDMLSLVQLNNGFQRLPTGGCGWFGVKFLWSGPVAHVAALGRFRSPHGSMSHNVSIFSGGKVLASTLVGHNGSPQPAADASGFVWQQAVAELERGGTYILASQEGGADGFFGEASSGGCASNSDGHSGG